MYSMVLVMALSGSADVPLHRHGCHCGCWGGGCYSCGGCWGGGCYGGCYGGGCYGGGCYGGCSGGCWGGGCYGGCYGGGCWGGGCYGGGCYGGGCSGGYAGCCGGYGGGYAMPVYTDTGTGTGTGGKSGGKSGGSRQGGGGDGEMGSLNGDAPATLVVSLPADAKLTVDGHTTTSTTALRHFTTPPLERGKVYSYSLRAEMTVDGKSESVTRPVTVRAGEETRVTLSLPVSTASSR
jgi:uncharacterized protein (TIGR03000 family)